MTTPEVDWEQLQQLFERGLELTGKDRQRFIDEHCRNDAQLAQELSSLFAAFEPGECELEASPLQLKTHAGQPTIAERGRTLAIPPDSIPGYELEVELSRGGQGVVYRAIQLSTKRQVAVKVLLEGPFAGEASRRRFEREVELVGRLQHPGIIPVFDSGLAQGQYFYAMPFVKGESLHHYVRDRELSTRQIVTLFGKICDAINFAHQNGVIHRDLKPSNILVDENGRPQVLDFGLAKLGDSSSAETVRVSLTGQVMGTLAYMSPEQASGAHDTIDTRSDVYALGVVLYELLAERLPYKLDQSMRENLSTIQFQEPERLSQTGKRVSGELSTIVLKALNKEKTRRYQSAGELGDDLRRFLNGDAINAKRDTPLYLLRKTAWRYRYAGGVLAGFVVLVLISAIVAWTLLLSVQSARKRELAAAQATRNEKEKLADEKQNLAELQAANQQQLYFAEMNLAGQAALRPGGTQRVRDLTARWFPDVAGGELRGWEWYYLRSRLDREAFRIDCESAPTCVAWSHDQSWIASGTKDGTIHVVDAKRGEHRLTLNTDSKDLNSIGWLANDRFIATTTERGLTEVWDAQTGASFSPSAAALDRLDGAAGCEVSLDGRYLAVASRNGPIEILDTESWQIEWTRDGRSGVCEALSWHPDGRWLAASYRDGSVVVWQDDRREPEFRERIDDQSISAIDWCARGSRLVVASELGVITLIELSRRRQQWQFRMENEIADIACHPEAPTIAVAHKNRTVTLIDENSTDTLGVIEGHADSIEALAWSGAGEQLVTVSRDLSLRVWNRDDAFGSSMFQHLQRYRIGLLACSPCGKWVAVGGDESDVLLLECESGETVARFPGHALGVDSLRWDHRGEYLATADEEGVFRVWDVNRARIVKEYDFDLGRAWQRGSRGNDHALSGVAWSPDDRLLAVASRQGELRMVAWQTDQPVQTLWRHRHAIEAIDWHPTLDLLVVGDRRGSCLVVDRESRDPVFEQRGHEDMIRDIRWSPTGDQFATAGGDSKINIWKIGQRQPLNSFQVGAGPIQFVRWHPDGHRLASGERDGRLAIWSLASPFETCAIELDGDLFGVSWDPAGEALFASAEHGQLRRWDASTAYRENRD